MAKIEIHNIASTRTDAPQTVSWNGKLQDVQNVHFLSSDGTVQLTVVVYGEAGAFTTAPEPEPEDDDSYPYILLKWGKLKGSEIPAGSEAAKLIDQIWDNWGKLTRAQEIKLTCKAIRLAPEGTRFFNNFTDEEYTREQAINYVKTYDQRNAA